MTSNSITKFYVSNSNVQSNLNCAILLAAAGVKFEVISEPDVTIPLYPAISANNTLVFGEGGILRYVIYHILAVARSRELEDFFEFLEFQLLPSINDKNVTSALCATYEAKFQTISSSMPLNIIQYFVYSANRYIIDQKLSINSFVVSLTAAVESSKVHMEVEKMFQHMMPADLSELDWSAMGLLSSLRLIFTLAMQKTFKNIVSDDILNEALVVRCANASFGDFQFNNSMAIAKALKANSAYKGSTSPKEIAEMVCKNIPKNRIIESISTAPNGFVNITLSTSTLIHTIAHITQHGVTPPNLPKLNVLVDFSSPNIAKEMHVGHLRSTIIGDAICRILEFCGHDVMRVNHVGDWGTQFGMLITYLRETYPDILTNPPNISDLTAIYKESKKRFDTDESFKEQSRRNVVNLQSGDDGCHQIWQLLCDISRREFQRVYDALHVELKEMGESFYNPMIPAAIDRLRDLGLVYEEEGMQLVRLPHFSIPLILRKSDGGYGYDSTDMAAIYYRLFDLKRDWIIVITDSGQSPHFQMIYDAAQAAKWVDHQRLDHIGFGVVQGEDGKRFKTRSSETVRLIDLLDAAKDRMKQSLDIRNNEGKTNLNDEELSNAAEVIGYSAVKYFDLKQHPASNYVFSYDRMLDTRGDTAVYLLFAYARLTSILRKAKEERNIDISSLSINADMILSLSHPSERALGFELLMMNDVIKSVLADLLTNKLCDYLKEVSVKFTDFVTKCHVLNAEEINSRLLLCEATRRVLAKSFELLGIQTLERI